MNRSSNLIIVHIIVNVHIDIHTIWWTWFSLPNSFRFIDLMINIYASKLSFIYIYKLLMYNWHWFIPYILLVYLIYLREKCERLCSIYQCSMQFDQFLFEAKKEYVKHKKGKLIDMHRLLSVGFNYPRQAGRIKAWACRTERSMSK